MARGVSLLGPGVGSASSPARALLPALRRWPVGCAPPGRKAGLWPRVPAASGQEALSSSPPGHLGLCLFPAQASSKRHLSLQVGAGCLRRCESRRGGSRPGRQVTLLCVGQSLPASPRDFTTTAAQLELRWGPPGRGLLCPQSPQASSVDTFPSTEEGGWLCPQRQSLQTVSKGWGFELGSPGSTGPSQPPSLQLV